MLAPSAKLRALVAPQGPQQPAQMTEAATAAEREVEQARALHRYSHLRLQIVGPGWENALSFGELAGLIWP